MTEGQDSAEMEALRERVRFFMNGDLDAAFGLVHSRSEFVLPDPIATEGRTYLGVEGFRAGMREWIGDRDAYVPRADRFLEAGPGKVLMLATGSGKDRHTGEPWSRKSSVLVIFKDGLVERCCVYETWEAGLEAAGLDPTDVDATPPVSPAAEPEDTGLWPGAG